MKENKLTIRINKPAKVVFEFAIDPKNAPKWQDAVATEEANEWPAKTGTIYIDTDSEGDSYEYKVTAFEQDKVFVLSQDWGYHERLNFNQIDANTTEVELIEWVEHGELDEMVTQEELEKLKRLLEAD